MTWTVEPPGETVCDGFRTPRRYRQELHWHAHGSDLTSFLDDARPVQG
jgi:hypothetical protein